MNTDRRKRIHGIVTKLKGLKSEIEELTSDEQGVFDDLPDGIRDSERGDALQEHIYLLRHAADNIEQIINDLDSAAEGH